MGNKYDLAYKKVDELATLAQSAVDSTADYVAVYDASAGIWKKRLDKGAGYLDMVAAGSSLTVTAASHANKLILLDTAAGSAITLPAATGSGLILKFGVSVKPTSNQHRISVVGDDSFAGSVNILDLDGAAQGAYAAGTDADQFDLNGTTKGGQVGDYVEIIDFVADKWLIRGQLVVPTGSNPATPFATGQVS